jgi:hypothetical protein
VTNPYDTGRFAEVSGLDQVESHLDVAGIVQQMLTDLREHPNEWENGTLERFLDALAASLEALPAAHTNRGEQTPTQPTWQLIAKTLVKASGYE